MFIIYTLLTIIIVVFCSYKIINWLIENKKNDKVIKEVQTSINDTKTIKVDNKNVKTFVIDYYKLKKLNNDYIGWLKVTNTNINYPIVYYNTNDYYS